MDIRDFITGTQAEKDQCASMIVQASFAFSAKIIMLMYQYSDEMPDEMREEAQFLLSSFHGYVGEFIDFDGLEQAMQAYMQGDDEDDSTA